jgi:hypothetical protein
MHTPVDAKRALAVVVAVLAVILGLPDHIPVKDDLVLQRRAAVQRST